MSRSPGPGAIKIPARCRNAQPLLQLNCLDFEKSIAARPFTPVVVLRARAVLIGRTSSCALPCSRLLNSSLTARAKAMSPLFEIRLSRKIPAGTLTAPSRVYLSSIVKVTPKAKAYMQAARMRYLQSRKQRVRCGGIQAEMRCHGFKLGLEDGPVAAGDA